MRRALAGVVVGASVGCTGGNVDVDLGVRLASGLDVEFADVKDDVTVDVVTAEAVLPPAPLGEPLSVAARGPTFFEVNLVRDDKLVGLGRSGVVDLTESGAVSVPVLVGEGGRVVVGDPSPPQNPGACVATDGTGHIFVIGGNDPSQGVYEFSVDGGFVTVVADGGDRAIERGGLGCGALAGHAVFVGGDCESGDAALDIVDVDKDIVVPVNGGAECGARAVRVGDNYWYVSSTKTLRMSRNGVVQIRNDALVDVKAVLANNDGGTFVLAGGDFVGLEDGRNSVRFSQVAAIGRMGGEVVAYAGTRLIADDGDELRSGLPAITPNAFTVLGDLTVVSILADGGAVAIDDADGGHEEIVLPRPHNDLVAIDGDTVVLAGGGGFDVLVLSTRDLFRGR